MKAPWEPLASEGRDYFAVVDSEADGPRPFAIFEEKRDADEWIERMSTLPDEARRHGPGLSVMVVRSLKGKAWNHLCAAPPLVGELVRVEGADGAWESVVVTGVYLDGERSPGRFRAQAPDGAKGSWPIDGEGLWERVESSGWPLRQAKLFEASS